MSDFKEKGVIYLNIKSIAEKLKISEKPNILLVQIGAHDLAHEDYLDNFYRNVSELLT